MRVELLFPGLVREVGDGDGGAAAGDLPLPDAPGGEAGDGEAQQEEPGSDERQPRSGEGGPPAGERSEAPRARNFPSLGLAAGSSDSAARHHLRDRPRNPGELRRPEPSQAPRAFGASHISSVFASDAPRAGAGVGVLSTGRFPVSISPSTIPAAQTSARSSTAAPAACSGAMYAGVPAPLDPSVPSRWASPKSSSFTRPSSQTKTFAGFEIPVQHPA